MVNPALGEIPLFPANESYGLQQAWCLFYDKQNISRERSYEIERDFPEECSEMNRRLFVIVRRQFNIPDPAPDIKIPDFIHKIYVKIDSFVEKFYDTYPKTATAATLIGSAALVSSVALFFFGVNRYNDMRYFNYFSNDHLCK